MKKFIKVLIVIIISITCHCGPVFGKTLNINDSDYVIINNRKVFLNVADTQSKRSRGLMFVDKLSEDQGMVFLFDISDYEYFWMKNMKIPLDIVFINDNKIAKIYKEVPVCKSDNCKLYNSEYKVDTVLELKTGFCSKYNVKVGELIRFSDGVKIKQNNLKSKK